MAKKPPAGGMTGEARSASPSSCAADPLDAFDLTETERADLLAALQRIVRHFVDLAFEGDALICLSPSEHSLAVEGERIGPPDSGRKGGQS